MTIHRIQVRGWETTLLSLITGHSDADLAVVPFFIPILSVDHCAIKVHLLLSFYMSTSNALPLLFFLFSSKN